MYIYIYIFYFTIRKEKDDGWWWWRDYLGHEKQIPHGPKPSFSFMPNKNPIEQEVRKNVSFNVNLLSNPNPTLTASPVYQMDIEPISFSHPFWAFALAHMRFCAFCGLVFAAHKRVGLVFVYWLWGDFIKNSNDQPEK